MRITKKWFAALLAFLLLAQLTPSLAEESAAPTFSDALASGQEVAYSIEFSWHSPALLDDMDINSVLASLFDAIEIQGYHGQTSDTDSYGRFSLLINGEDALPYEYVITSESKYCNSPIYGGGIAMKTAELDQIVLNFSTFLSFLTGTPVESYTGLFESMLVPYDEATAEDAEDTVDSLDAYIDEMIALYNLAPIMEIITAWEETTLVGDVYEDDIVSVFGVETASATVYEITKAELVELLTDILTEMQENDALLTAILINNETPDVEPTQEELDQARLELTSLIETLDTAIPDGMIMRYDECYDADGNHVVSEIEFYMPYDENEDENALIIYIEWLPDTLSFYGIVLDSGDGFSFVMQGEPAETVETEEGTIEYSWVNAIVSIYEAEATIAEVTLSCETVTSLVETGVAKKTEFSIGISEEELGEIGSLQIILNQEDTYLETGLASVLTCDCNLVMSYVSMPIFNVEINVESQEAQGAPFDPESGELTFVQVGQMTEEEFVQWSSEDLAANYTKTLMHVLSLLPTEVMVSLMQDAGVAMDYSLDINN